MTSTFLGEHTLNCRSTLPKGCGIATPSGPFPCQRHAFGKGMWQSHVAKPCPWHLWHLWHGTFPKGMPSAWHWRVALRSGGVSHPPKSEQSEVRLPRRTLPIVIGIALLAMTSAFFRTVRPAFIPNIVGVTVGRQHQQGGHSTPFVCGTTFAGCAFGYFSIHFIVYQPSKLSL